MKKTKILIDAIIANDKKQAALNAFKLVMAEKIEAALKAKKQMVAQQIYK